MNDRAGANARVSNDVSPAAGDNGAATLYIINLISSTTPMPLEVPDAPELEGFAVFRSRRVEDGRDRFRMHVGYFESPEDAARVLPVVRVRYPAAWIALAPHDSMGSLDDTSVAEFKYIRQNRSANPAREKLPPRKPAAPVAVVATLVSAGSPNRPVARVSSMTASFCDSAISTASSPPGLSNAPAHVSSNSAHAASSSRRAWGASGIPRF